MSFRVITRHAGRIVRNVFMLPEQVRQGLRVIPIENDEIDVIARAVRDHGRCLVEVAPGFSIEIITNR